MRYRLTLIVDTGDRFATADDVEDAAYLACNEIAESNPGWFVDLTGFNDNDEGDG